ncbi:HAD family hydrolase [uncultured Thalassospira sp.]|jgi:phosphoglycolate phosphatase-like HAD superfamily hydrolase|uniref:HAD family hydrolase n=1 Tax=uncultured Thalassospira sp. TaxID=404382 RepID=UPI0032B2433B|tara:strand:- start:225 stop:905 length:681 start_codon:yes stop_codon:yes gene_type:complete
MTPNDMLPALRKVLEQSKLFAFDFDGTLVQSNEIKRQAFYLAVGNDPRVVSTLDELLASREQLNRYQLFDRISLAHPGFDSRDLVERYSGICDEKIRQAPEVPGALSLLTKLKQAGKTSVICSATPEEALAKTVVGLPIFPLVEKVLGQPKSKTEHLLACCDEMSIDSRSVVMVGDGILDQVAAREVGCAFVAVKSDNNDFDICPDFWVKDLFELRSLMFSEKHDV